MSGEVLTQLVALGLKLRHSTTIDQRLSQPIESDSQLVETHNANTSILFQVFAQSFGPMNIWEQPSEVSYFKSLSPVSLFVIYCPFHLAYGRQPLSYNASTTWKHSRWDAASDTSQLCKFSRHWAGQLCFLLPPLTCICQCQTRQSFCTYPGTRHLTYEGTNWPVPFERQLEKRF